MGARLNTIRRLPAGYQPPELPERCTTSDLAQLLCGARRHGASAQAPISDSGVERLLELAFDASLEPNEGRYPQCRLRVASPTSLSQLAAFKEEISSARVLSELTCLCHHPEHALSVVEDGSTLRCIGLVDVSPMGLDGLPGRPEIVDGGSPIALDLQIRGPGHLILRDVGCMLQGELRSGRFHFLSPWSAIPQLAQLLDEFGTRCEDGVSIDDRKYFGGARTGMSSLARVLLIRILGHLVHAGHGGAILIHPLVDGDIKGIGKSVSVDGLDLKESILRFWKRCIDDAKGKSQSRDLRWWIRARAELESTVAAISGLANVDGSIVIDRELRVRQFAAHIDVDDTSAEKSERSFRSAVAAADSVAGLGEAFEYGDFMKLLGGTRHRSAARLCKRVEGAIALVVSQDRTMKVFCSDSNGAYGYRDIDPGS